MVTGSGYLVTGDSGAQLLVDLGMFQETEEVSARNYAALSFASEKLAGVVLTHAHLDHCGRLPLLVQHGYGGKFYMTKATRELASLVLFDAAKIQVEDKKGKILYTDEDIEKLLTQVEEVDYDTSFTVGEFEIVFRDAGHILGSASIEVKDGSGKTIVFSGDLGNTPEDMIRPTEMVNDASYVVMESTYGDKLHKQEDPSEVLREEINEIEKNGGVLLIPAFSIERAQELLHRINHLKNDGAVRAKTLVFLDSPMAIKATMIFAEHPELFNKELHKEMEVDDPFDFPGFSLTASVEDSKKILFAPGPKVIISGSGMMSGGRVLHHAINYLSQANTRVLIVGYQAERTLGRFLLSGAKQVRIYDRDVRVAAHVRGIDSMSCHADQEKLLEWVGHIKGVEKVFLTHGEEETRIHFKEKIQESLQIGEVVCPRLDEVIVL